MAQDIKINGVTFRGVDMLRVPLADDSGSAVYKDASNLVSPIDIKGIFAGNATEINDINGEINGSVGTRVLNNNDSLVSLILPAATSMANEAARYCDNLLYVKMDKCETLNYRAFRECPKLKEADFPKLKTIGQEAFCYCYALKDTNFPLVETIGIDAFYNDNTIEALSFPALKTLNTRAFYGCTKLETLNMPNLKTINANDVFYNCTALKSVSFPNLTTVSGEYMFRNSYIEEVIFPLLTALYYRIFREAKGLKQITCPELVTELNAEAFYNVPTLLHASFPKLKQINRDAFGLCTGLTSLTFPKLERFSEGNQFNGCSHLVALFLPNEDFVCVLANTNTFSNTPIASGTGYVYVPLKWIDIYKKASNWVTYKNQIKSKESYDDDTATDYAISIVRNSNCKPLCRYVTSKGTYNGRDRTILGAKASDSIAYTISSPGYVTMTGTKSISDADTDVSVDASSMVADENFNGVNILNFDFTKLEPDYSNYGSISYGNYGDYYHNIKSDGIGGFNASKFFPVTISVPDYSGMDNPTFVLEMLVKQTDEEYSNPHLYSMGGTNTNTGCLWIYKQSLGHYANGQRMIVENLDLIGEHHIAYVVTSTQVHLYIDGELKGTYNDTYLFSGLQYTTPRIGNNQSSTGQYFHGKLKQLALTVRDIDDPTDAADYFLLDIPESDGE